MNKIAEMFLRNSIEDNFFRKLKKKIDKKIDLKFGYFIRKLYMNSVKINPKKVFFYTFQGDYTCNPKYITDEFFTSGADVEIVWSYGDGKLDGKFSTAAFPKGIKKVKKNSFEFFRELASSKVIIVNSFIWKEHPFSFKRKQILIQTWHGSLGIKRFGREDKKEDKVWIKSMDKLAKRTNYLVSNSKFETAVYRETFWPKTEVLEFGHPRNSLLCGNNTEKINELRKKIFKKYKIENMNSKIVLYAPTFRNSKSLQPYNIDFGKLKKSLKEKFGGDWIVLLRLHPTVASKKLGANTLKNVIDVTTYTDIQELIAISDVGITDYSSWIYDYVLLRKPGFIYATDIEKYDQERGFYYPLEETPFPLCINNEQLNKAILDFDIESYKENVENFLIDKNCVDSEEASSKLCNFILHEIIEK